MRISYVQRLARTGTTPDPIVIADPCWISYLRGPDEPISIGHAQALRRGERVFVPKGTHKLPVAPPVPRSALAWFGYLFALSDEPLPADQGEPAFIAVAGVKIVAPSQGPEGYAERAILCGEVTGTVVRVDDGVALTGIALEAGSIVVVDLPTRRQADLYCSAGQVRVLYQVDRRLFTDR